MDKVLCNKIDLHVGNKLKIKRKVCGLTQRDIGDEIGTTFQQVQKYESGENRISASKLFLLSKLFKTNTSYFFEGIDEEIEIDWKDCNSQSITLLNDFNAIRDQKIKNKIKGLIQCFRESQEEECLSGT